MDVVLPDVDVTKSKKRMRKNQSGENFIYLFLSDFKSFKGLHGPSGNKWSDAKVGKEQFWFTHFQSMVFSLAGGIASKTNRDESNSLTKWRMRKPLLEWPISCLPVKTKRYQEQSATQPTDCLQSKRENQSSLGWSEMALE